ncbi:MAG: leucine-rich repeat domain-containing protein [Clostridia bacterium]|nr:leucine-rich repeat domain-containing protein [Clostridia bacterium]
MSRIAWLFFFLTMICSSALATMNLEMNWVELDSGLTVDDAVLNRPKSTLFPVFSAPFENAYRGADGKAAVSLKEPFVALASTQDLSWLLIEYRVSEKNNRIGWIRIFDDASYDYEHVRDWERRWDNEEVELREKRNQYLSDVSILDVADLLEVQYSVPMTDDPHGGKRVIRELKKGERAGGLFVDGEWMYIITKVDGKRACGFVPRDSVQQVRCATLKNNVLTVEPGIELLGMLCDTVDAGGIDYVNGGPVRAVAEFGMIQGCFLDEFNWDELKCVEKILLPDTLRVIGDDAIFLNSLEELVIPEGVEYIRGFSPFMKTYIKRLVLPSTLRDFSFYLRFTSVEAYALDERNPYLESVDGVIFTKDRKKLLSYPNGRKDQHYTVPKGTEEIGEHAFYIGPDYDEEDIEPVQLRSISLPVGLKKIGPGAFRGCDELISLTIPPTVTEIYENAFGEMYNLQYLTMPDELQNSFYSYWKNKRTGLYTGDNL